MMAGVLPPPTAARLLLPTVADPLSAAGVALLAVWYFRAVARLDGSWPRSRARSFVGGLAVLLYGTSAGLGRYESVLFGAHVAQHLLIGMVAPLLLALGRPVTLELLTTTPRRRRRVVRALHSRPARVLGHPAIATGVLFG